eukprot:scaffold4990_cov387-Prasinococcus_capsulatus_cf.AAC.44
MASFRPPVESIGLEDDGAASDEDRMTILSRRQVGMPTRRTQRQLPRQRFSDSRAAPRERVCPGEISPDRNRRGTPVSQLRPTVRAWLRVVDWASLHWPWQQRTGITQKEQNLMVGAYKVRKTLVDEGRVSEEVISYFNTLDAAELLYEFRAIPTELREDMVRSACLCLPGPVGLSLMPGAAGCCRRRVAQR